MVRTVLLSICAVFLLSSCVSIPKDDIGEFISRYGNDDPAPSRFIFCYNHGCSRAVTVSLNNDQWNEAKKVFQPPPENAAEERRRISFVIGVLETIVGKITGTDTYKRGSFRGWLFANRLDCVDDAANTGTYLFMLRKEGLIRFHEIREPAHRGFLLNFKWPHVATVIIEKGTGHAYVVDSSFLDNGYPAFIVPFDAWAAGWKPQKMPAWTTASGN